MRIRTDFGALGEALQDEVAQVLLDTFADDFARQGVVPERARSFLAQNFQAHNGLLTGWEEDDLVAIAGYVRTMNKYYVCNVWTHPLHRGKGLARDTIGAVEETLRSKHHQKHVYLWCDKSLVDFYSKMGYARKMQTQMARDKFVEVMTKALG